MTISEVLVLGDSVFKGVIYDATRQRYALLKESAVQILSTLLPFPIINQSQMGRTAPEGLKLLQRQSARALEGRAVMLEYGGNDCDFDWKAVAENPEAPHVPHTSAEVFTDSLHRMVSRVRDCGGYPILSTLPPLDADRYLRWITRSGLSRDRILRFIGVPERIYRWQEYYSSLILRVSAETLCACAPVREAFLERVRGEDVLCADGIHPNAAGHRIIADAMLQFAQSMSERSLANPLPGTA